MSTPKKRAIATRRESLGSARCPVCNRDRYAAEMILAPAWALIASATSRGVHGLEEVVHPLRDHILLAAVVGHDCHRSPQGFLVRSVGSPRAHLSAAGGQVAVSPERNVTTLCWTTALEAASRIST
jgi:hypothetical protein